MLLCDYPMRSSVLKLSNEDYLVSGIMENDGAG